MKKFTVEQFAHKIRKKYPNVYDDILDTELVDLWIKKYPNDKEHIIYDNYESPNQTNETSSFGWLKNLFFLVLLVLGGYYLFNNKTKSNNSNQQIDSKGESNIIDNRMSEQEIEAQLNNIFNSQENSKEDNSPLSIIEKAVRSLKSSEKKYFINILNSNSDPDGKIDMRCGTEVTPCEWCGTSISYYSKWNSRISDMKTITNPWVSMYTSLALVFGGAFSGQDPVESVKNDLRENFRLIEDGEIYYCSKSNPPKFCSKNCEYQNSIHR
jgi:hypothetical protein